MTKTTLKQIDFATMLFEYAARLAARNGWPLKATSFAEEMVELNWNPEDGRDVEAYIDMHLDANVDAIKTLRRR
jgi:hypothetical protein